jgi:long-chain acyl-CoA synthetase
MLTLENKITVERIDASENTGPDFVTLFDAIRYHAATTPSKIALIDAESGLAISYSALASRIESFAEALSGLGVRQGTGVVIVMPRSSSLVEILLALSRVGAWAAAYMSPRDLEEALSTARTALIPGIFIYSSDHADPGKLARSGERWIDFNDLSESREKAPVEFAPDGETILYLNETSGSTSRPKLVPASHAVVIANTKACITALGITPDDIHLCTFLSHAHEVFARPLLSGGTAVILHRSIANEPLAYLSALVRYKVTCLMSNATSYMALVNLSGYARADFSLRLAESGGMPTPESLRNRVAKTMGATLVPVWGSTETAGVAIAPPKDEICRSGSVGKAIAGYEISVVDEKGRVLRPGENGELSIAGPAVASHYIASEDHDQLKASVFRTGDRASIDKDSWVYINGRIRNEFKVAGILVSSEKIESAISTSSFVKEVAVIPVSHPVYGYVAAALIVLEETDARSLDRKTEQRIIRNIIESTERNVDEPFLELPRRIKWVEELSRTSASKLNRRALPADFADPRVRPVKVRLSIIKHLRLALSMIKRRPFLTLFVRNPLGTVRLLMTLLRGEKAK